MDSCDTGISFQTFCYRCMVFAAHTTQNCCQCVHIRMWLYELFCFLGNPLQEKHAADGDWISVVSTKNKTIRKLDG